MWPAGLAKRNQEMSIQADRFQFRPLKSDDLPLLCDWLNRHHVAERWYGELSEAEIRSRYIDRLIEEDSKSCSPLVVQLGERPIGFAQWYWATKIGNGWWSQISDPGTVGIDFFLADFSMLGKGYGTEMIAQLVEALFANPEITTLISDPPPDNTRSIRALERNGFIHLGLIDTPDGKSLLLEKKRV
jgi:RimJ/RimL family protein N-acetyltransferase